MAEPEIKKALTVLDTLSRNPEMVRLAELRMKKILDEKSMIEGAKEEGLKKGLEKGRTEGIKEGIKRRDYEIVISALKSNLDIDVIKNITGLSKEEIMKIKNDLGSD